MSSTLRAAAFASCSALLVSGAVGLAATPAAGSTAAFSVSPSFGRVGKTVTLSGATFTSTDTVTFNNTPSSSVNQVSAHKLTAVVPGGATTGKVVVHQGLTSLNGPKFTVQQLTHATSSTSAKTLTYGHKLLVKAHERNLSGDPIVGQGAALQHRSGPSKKWKRAPGILAKKTGKAGGAKWRIKPHANGQYRVYFRQSHTYVGRSTAAHGVRVLPRLHLRQLHTIGQFDTASIRGSVHPHLAGQVYLQRSISGSWKRVRTTKAAAGHFSFSISPSSLGHLRYRVVRRHDRHHGLATSRVLNIQVVRRTLGLGDSGHDVLALQKRLRQLHYDVGPRNGTYGYDTLHAVTAFQKVNGLNKDGSAGNKVFKRLNNPKRVHLHYPGASSGLAVEVNIKKQVLLLSKGGKIWRILDTSTAGGYYYTNSAGQSEKAVTPRGHFTIQYKQTGWQKSKLGELYYPSYFTNTGYAIHGEGNGNSGGEVPPYPASHGCVRITNDAVLRYYDDLSVGTSVWVYG
jgi:peptidoglycan hydrolase-like protein with peptidoglycan-binding domain